jgi:Uncharacterised methyltransferase family (DUF6094)
MALIFSRLAHNFIKHGYFPTDEDTLSRILTMLEPAGDCMRIYDPCCGEGTALAELKHALQGEGDECRVEALGVEFDAERAWHAKDMLDTAIHSDVNDVFLTRRSCSLLFLNPPYGTGVSDKGCTGDKRGTNRLEHDFLRGTYDALQIGGVLILIVPSYVVDDDMATLLARNFERLHLHMSPEPRFKQCVITGVRRRAGHPPAAVIERLISGGRGELASKVLPSIWEEAPYLVPDRTEDAAFRFQALRIDGPQLSHDLLRMSGATLWSQFDSHFQKTTKAHRPPLRNLSKWHLALALAAGQIIGIVKSVTGRVLMIKGDTYKDKKRSVEYTTDDKGNVSETVIMTDRFVPIIRGIDMTDGDNLGRLVTIR